MSAWREQLERELGPDALDATADGPGITAAPDTIEGLQAAMAVANEHGLVVLPTGLGSKARWCALPERVDLRLSTRRLTGVVSYEPGDGTVSARAGTTMAALRATVREGGHHLTPDVPLPESATLGGVISAGQSGFDRLRYGPVRNALLGARALLADGRVTRSGGQLVKNVTGYDLHRLYCGAHGTLSLLVEVSLRLHPLQAARRVLARDAADRAEALALASRALAAAARHLAVWCDDHEGAWRVSVALSGRAEVVAHEADLVRAALGGEIREAEGDPAQAICDAARDAVLAARGSNDVRPPSWPTLEITSRPSELSAALGAVERAVQGVGGSLRVLAHPGVAQAFVRCDGIEPAQVPALGALPGVPRARVALRDHPEALHDQAGPSADATAMMRELQTALDPDARFARGRLPGGL